MSNLRSCRSSVLRDTQVGHLRSDDERAWWGSVSSDAPSRGHRRTKSLVCGSIDCQRRSQFTKDFE